MKNLPSLTFVLLTAAACPAATVIIPAAADATLYESAAGSLANGGGEFLFAGRTLQATGVSVRRGLIEFDIASFIPAGSIIDSATLTLHSSLTRASGTVVSVHRVTREWSEGTTNASGNEGGGASVTGNDATWLHATFNSVFWSGPGAAGDFNSVATGSTTILGSNGFYSWPGLQSDVQAWLANDDDNHGWLLIGNETSAATAVQFDSRSSANDDNLPILVIEYTPVPEPGTMVLAAAGIAVLRRRRR